MNERIQELAEESFNEFYNIHIDLEKFVELIVSAVLDEVSERAYYSGDRAWSDSLDRRWVELEFGIGKLAKLKK
jgi:DNA-binding ferritin-like protein